MAELIREGIDILLRRETGTAPQDALERTLGALPDLDVPGRDEWDRLDA